MSRPTARAILCLILAIGAFFRFQDLDWDEGHHLHPDERFISMVEEKLAFPRSPAEYLDSLRSPLNPYNRGHDSFVYGTFPVFLTKAIAVAAHRDGYDGAYLFGRALSGLFDLFTIWLVYRLGRRFGGRRTALSAAALLAFCPLGIQLSHFWAVDTFLATFTTLALYGCARLAQGRSSPLEDAATGLALGLAVACKVTGLALFAPAGIALLLWLGSRRGETPADEGAPRLLRAVGRGVLLTAAALLTIRAALPYAFVGLHLDPRYVRDMKQLALISSSVAGFPPALQWAGRSVLFPVENFVFWGAGPLFAVAAIAAVLWACAAARRKESRALLPLAVYAVFVALYHGLTLVKSIRYFYPAYPTAAVLTAIFLARVAPSRVSERTRRALAAAVVGGTFLAALAFTSVYRHPHTRVEASRWIFAHVPPPARFANESWDDGQPIPLPGYDGNGYAGPTLDLYDPDSREKAEKVLVALRHADWIAVTSNRVYGNVTRIPAVFPMTVAYYRALFGGALGFRRAAEFTSYPSLGPLRFDDDRAEEQFTVYDHPRVLLFQKTPEYSEPRARAILLAAIPTTPPSIYEWEKWPRNRRTSAPAVIPAHEAETASAASAEREISSFAAAAIWYLASALVGAAAFPLAWSLFSRLSDRGFGFARIVGLAAGTYALNLAVARGGLANGRGTAGLVLLLLFAAGGAAFLRRRREILDFVSRNRRILWQSEIVFAAGFVLFLAFRAWNPEITWGEKPMDFSILNILVRTRTLPPSDPWFSGAPLGYYTFGQEMVAWLTLLSGISTRYTFNLAFGLLGGAILQGAYALARSWAGTRAAGVAGLWLVGLAGNLSGLREWLFVRRPQHLALEWNYFWATSRVVKDTINEYPLWSLLFADLHAHVLAIPFFLLFAATALQFVRAHSDSTAFPRTRILAAGAMGAAAAGQVLTNAWDAPVLAGVLILAAVAAALPEGGVSFASAGRAIVGLSVAATAAAALAVPLWPRGGSAPALGRNVEQGASGFDVTTVFGLFFYLAAAWWFSAAADRLGWRGARRAVFPALGVLLFALLGLRSAEAACAAGIVLFVVAVLAFATTAEERLAIGFVGAGFFLVLFAQRFYINDRMNTFFKLYLATWLLLALGTAALVFRPPERRGAFVRWPGLLKAGFAVVAGLSLFTTVTAARGALTDTRPTRKGSSERPTLDGLRYLEKTDPGEYRAIEWMRSTIRGTPVVLEAQGPSYQEFGRVSMLTGLPTVLGWEYHVQQRGNPAEEIAARRAAIEKIYASPTPDAVEAPLRRYHVGYVYVGPLERKTYPGRGLAKFAATPELFRVAYENPQVRVYRVVGGDAEDVLTPALRETLPAETAGTGPSEALEPEEAPILMDRPAEARPPFSGMKEPRDAAVDDRGRLWIADFGNSRLRLFDRDGGYLGGWGGRGDGTFQFREPCGVAVRGDDLYIADTWNGRVLAFTVTAAWKAVAKDLYGPRGVAAAPDGSVWVSDTGNHRLAIYGRDLGNPRFIGKPGAGPLEFSAPVGIAAGPSGSIYVCDTGNRRIQVLDSAGRFQRAVPFPGWTGSVEPHVEADDDETLYATDPSSNSVLEIAPTGRVAARWDSDDAGKKFDRPTGVALDRKDRILYVVNSGDGSISKKRLSERKER